MVVPFIGGVIGSDRLLGWLECVVDDFGGLFPFGIVSLRPEN
jgi:hypothetical protein